MSIIPVNGIEIKNVMKIFSGEVSKGNYTSIPYQDFKKIKNYHRGVNLVFYPEDMGDVVIYPDGYQENKFYRGNKNDGSLGAFLWEYFYKERKENMYKESKSPDKYDLWGLSSSADKLDATTAVAKTSNDYHSWDSLSTEATIAADKVSISPTYGWTSVTDTVEQLKARVEELGHMLQVDTDRLNANMTELAETTTKSLAECYETMEAQLAKKADVAEMEYRLEDRTMDILSDLDEVRYDTRELMDRLCELEDNCNKNIEKSASPCIAYDMYGVPHEVQGVSTQSTSSSYYPTKGYGLNIKPDIMAGNDRKEKENMDTAKMFNFDFGPVASHIRMSPYGLAMKNADGKYVSYDKATGNIMDVEIFNFDAQKFLYKMPVAISAIAVGDIVVHMRKAMFVRAVNNGVVSVIDIYNGEVKDILPTKSPFGFNFITKVVSLIDMTGADANSPFGNMLPLLMMGEGQDFKDILPLMFFANGNNTNMMNNPLMMYALLNNNNNIDSLGFFLALSAGMGGNNPFAPAAPAHDCGCHNHNPEGQCHNG